MIILLVSFLLVCSLFANAFIDLAINNSGINFSNDNPIEGENITINATISNLGNESAENVTVQFLDDSVEIGNKTVNISAFSSKVASQYWKTEIGPNTITVIADSDNIIIETNENNNIASKDISISAYHIYYGTAKSYLGLGIKSDLLLNLGFLNGSNILVTDTDCNVDFSSLQAIGRRKNFGRGFFDFRNIDVLFGMENFTDSISRIYSRRGYGMLPKQTETFTVFGDSIARVPVVESTNNSIFKTGILWDTSDDSSGFWGQFDISDQEDLVFITEIKESQSGAYGIYDYEIKVPALLRDYKPGNPTVDFYLDLDFLN